MNNEDDKYKASNFIKKNDDDFKYHSSNFINKKENKKPSFLQRASQDVEEHINKPIESLGRSARNLIGGYGQGLANIAPGLYNLGASGINALGGNIPKSPLIDIVPKSPSTYAGEIASFFSAPGFLKSVSKIPELVSTAKHATKIPMIAEGIKHASNILEKYPVASRITGNSILGGAYSPENPLIGMGLGAAGGLLGEGIGKGYSGIKNSLKNNEILKKNLSKFNPSLHAKELENQLSGGLNNITQNSYQLANDIRKAHAGREQEAGAFFNHALKSAGHEPIYGMGHKDILTSKVPEYNRQQKTLEKIKELKVGDLFNSFKSNPSFENSHKLQSELGFMERELKSNPLKTQDDIMQLKKISSARNQLKSDINNYLEKRDITSNNPIMGHYNKGSELYEANVAPYLSDSKLIDIVKGGKTAVKDLHKVFDTPSNIITKQGIEKIGNINKIMKDLPESSKMRILFDAIGGNKLTPQSLMQKLHDIKSKGYESYFTPEIEESINSLGKKLNNKNNLKMAGKLAGGSAALAAGGNVLNHLF